MTKDEAIKIVWNLTEIINDYDLTDEIEEAIHMAAEALEGEKIGRWIEDKCSVCGEERAWYGYNPLYCPDCGARMEEEN